MAKIYIDSGHGGRDSGATGNGLYEKDITLDIALKAGEYLQQYEGAEVKQSRTGDTYPTLDDRTDEANSWGADLLVSIHINAATATAHGFETYVYTAVDTRTKAFQNVLHNKVLKATGFADRGQKAKNLHMCRESRMPAVLTECGFISNKAEAAKMKDPSWRDQVAKAHAEGIAEFLGLQKKAAAPAPTKETEKLYKVQVAAFSSKERAEAMAADLVKLGYRPYIKYE